MTEPIGWLRAVVYDSDDLERLSAFWQEVLGTGVVLDVEGWLRLESGTRGTAFAFESMGAGLSAEAAAEVAKSPARCRPDIEVQDMDVARARVEALGGRTIALLKVGDEEENYRMADPDGNEFNLVLPEPS